MEAVPDLIGAQLPVSNAQPGPAPALPSHPGHCPAQPPGPLPCPAERERGSASPQSVGHGHQVGNGWGLAMITRVGRDSDGTWLEWQTARKLTWLGRTWLAAHGWVAHGWVADGWEAHMAGWHMAKDSRIGGAALEAVVQAQPTSSRRTRRGNAGTGIACRDSDLARAQILFRLRCCSGSDAGLARIRFRLGSCFGSDPVGSDQVVFESGSGFWLGVRVRRRVGFGGGGRVSRWRRVLRVAHPRNLAPTFGRQHDDQSGRRRVSASADRGAVA